MIKSLIIDDDPFIQQLLQDKLTQYVPEVQIIGTATSGAEALEKISRLEPELIFLDVEMADMTGFELLTKIENISFQVIFITSFAHYAIKAIRFNAMDYLVKPIDLGELKAAIKRFKKKQATPFPHQDIAKALDNLKTSNAADQKLILHTQKEELRIALKDIIMVEGERNYSYIYLIRNKRKLVTKTLVELEELLHDKGFFRCHKSFIVNAIHIQSPPTRTSLLLSDGNSIPIARRKKAEFINWWASNEHS
ncbi:MAG: two-component system LytT family response regulator [Flavobacteriales bacterium]|jgi:two-component system LytT family response regulator